MQTSQEHAADKLIYLHDLYQRAATFILRDIWVVDPAVLPAHIRFVLKPLRVMIIVVHGFFFGHQCLLRASSLTYTTLLALVPLLAFMFAFLKGLGVQNLLEPLLIEEFSSVGSKEVIQLILDFVKNVKVGTLSMFSLLMLLFTTLWQLRAIERALNEIWGVQGRPMLRKVTDYISMIVIGPVVLTLAVTVNTALQNQGLIADLLKTRLIGEAMALVFTLLSYIAVWLVFSFVYTCMPNTRVQVLPALIGGFVGSTLWQGAKWGYIAFQIGIAKNEAIYGAFAQLPVLMIWFYISWAVTLLGAEVSFACQYASTYPFESFGITPSIYTKEWLASSLYFSLTQAFTTGAGPWSVMTFAQQHRIPIRLLREVVAILVSAKLIVEVTETPEHYVPSRDPATLTPWDVLSTLRHHDDLDLGIIKPQDTLATVLMSQVEAAGQQVGTAQSVTQWLTEKEPAPQGS